MERDFFKLLEPFKVLMRAFDKENIILLFGELFQILYFSFRIIPDKSKVARDDQRVALLQLTEASFVKDIDISVCISCNVYQNVPPKTL